MTNPPRSRPTPPAPAAAPRSRPGRRATRASAPGPAAGAATRRRLLDAAGERFAAQGYRGATLREIAERAGANLAAANYHFGSKQALYLEVARERFEALERRLAEQGAGFEGDLASCSREELEALLRARARTMLRSFLEQDPVHAALMKRELLDPSEALRVIVRRWVAPQRAAMERILARLAPELTPDELARATFSAVGQLTFYLTHRPALLLMMGRRSLPPGFVEDAAEHVTEFTLGGLERLRAAHAGRRGRR